MPRMRGKGGPVGAGQGRRKSSLPEAAAKEPAGGASGKGMDRGSRIVVRSLMLGLLGVFLLIGLLAPDPLDHEGKPGGATVLWRLLFLLVPLAVMYGLLWGESFLGFFRRPKVRRGS